MTTSIKSKVLAAAVSLSMFGLAACGATAATTSADKATGTKENKMLVQSLEAAKASVSANQAIAIAQAQVANATAVSVHYGNMGMGMGKPPMAKKGDKAQADTQQLSQKTAQKPAQKAKETADKTPSYHVSLMDTDGKRYHVSVDASSGKVLSTDEMKKPERPAKAEDSSNSTNTADKERPEPPKMTAPEVSLTEAMQVAENSVGGEAVSAGMGHMMGGHHGGKGGHGKPPQGDAQNGERPELPANAENGERPQPPQGDATKGERPDLSYNVKVVKGDEVYMVKVDAQTGKVTDTKSMEEMKAEMDKKRAELGEKGSKPRQGKADNATSTAQ